MGNNHLVQNDLAPRSGACSSEENFFLREFEACASRRQTPNLTVPSRRIMAIQQ